MKEVITNHISSISKDILSLERQDFHDEKIVIKSFTVGFMEIEVEISPVVDAFHDLCILDVFVSNKKTGRQIGDIQFKKSSRTPEEQLLSVKINQMRYSDNCHSDIGVKAQSTLTTMQFIEQLLDEINKIKKQVFIKISDILNDAVRDHLVKVSNAEAQCQQERENLSKSHPLLEKEEKDEIIRKFNQCLLVEFSYLDQFPTKIMKIDLRLHNDEVISSVFEDPITKKKALSLIANARKS